MKTAKSPRSKPAIARVQRGAKGVRAGKGTSNEAAAAFEMVGLEGLTATELRRVRIVLTAAQLFAQHGFHATGMRQICEAVGMSPGALYRYFASKEQIIAGFIALDRQRTAAWFAALPVEEGLMACLERLTEMASGDLEQSGVLAMWTEITAEAARNPAVRAPFEEHYRFVEGMFAELVERAKEAGDIRPEVRARDVALFVMSGFEGLMVRRALVPDFDFDAAIGKLLAFIADALGSRRPKRERGVRA